MITFLAIFAEIQEQKETQLGATQQIPTQDGITVLSQKSQSHKLIDKHSNVVQTSAQETSVEITEVVKEQPRMVNNV
jgi:hypothetical protein